MTPAADPSRGAFLRTTLLLTLLGLSLRVFLLASQPVLPDDCFVALTAINYVEHGNIGPTMWNHPGLRNFLVYGAMKLFGTGVAGIKGVSLLLGVLTIPLLALVSRRLLRDERAALAATFLWTVEPLAIDFSRQAINDIYLAFFPLLGIYLCCRFRETGRVWQLFAAGAAFGCGIASKWSGVFPLGVTFLMLAAGLFRDPDSPSGERKTRLAYLAASLVLLPALVYLLTFAPWFGRGYGLAEWPALQQSMYRETASHTGYHPLEEDHRDHWAHHWFIRPVTYEDVYVTAEPAAGGGGGFEKRVTILLSVANPLVWLLVLPAMAFTLYRGIRERDEGLCYLSALFVCSYLPLALAGRPIWVDTALSVLPFALAGVAYWVGTAARGRVVRVYLAAVALTTLPLYLLVIGEGGRVPVLESYLRGAYAEKVSRLVERQPGMPARDIRP